MKILLVNKFLYRRGSDAIYTLDRGKCYSIEFKRKFERIIKITDPDIVHLNNIYLHIPPSILDVLKKQNIPVIMTLPELTYQIQKALVTITPSECYENNPGNAIESFAFGKPVIGARIGGIPELVIDGKTGYTFEPGNVVVLQAKIESLAGEPYKCMEMCIHGSLISIKYTGVNQVLRVLKRINLLVRA
jgi:hypothetical protein